VPQGLGILIAKEGEPLTRRASTTTTSRGSASGPPLLLHLMEAAGAWLLGTRGR
jgi:hypothetical protein